MNSEVFKIIIWAVGYIIAAFLGGLAALKIWREYLASNESKFKIKMDAEVQIAKEKSTGAKAIEELFLNHKKVSDDITELEKTIKNMRTDILNDKELLQKRLDILRDHFEQSNLLLVKALQK